MKFQVASKVPGQITPLHSRPDIAASVGCIISQFALIERLLPQVVCLTTRIDGEDAAAITGVFRAFANKLDMLEELRKRRADDSWESIVMSYFKGRFKIANTIRNKYAHAGYMGGKGGDLTIAEYFGDTNRVFKSGPLTLPMVEEDLKTMVRIGGELIDLIGGIVPKDLHEILPPVSRA